MLIYNVISAVIEFPKILRTKIASGKYAIWSTWLSEHK